MEKTPAVICHSPAPDDRVGILHLVLGFDIAQTQKQKAADNQSGRLGDTLEEDTWLKVESGGRHMAGDRQWKGAG